MYWFMTPRMIEEQQRAARARFDAAKSKSVDWADYKRPKAPELTVIKANTFNPVNPLAPVFGELEPMPPHLAFAKTDAPYVRASEGKPEWIYVIRRLPAGELLQMPFHPDRRSATVAFDQDIDIPVLQCNGQVWMSITPAEILTCRGGIRHAKGRTIIGGLGMGWQLHHIAEKKGVKEIVVVEESKRLIDWYGRELCERYGAEIVCGDIWEHIPRFDLKDRFVVDIWSGFWDARFSRPLMAARKAGYNIWAWGSERGGMW